MYSRRSRYLASTLNSDTPALIITLSLALFCLAFLFPTPQAHAQSAVPASARQAATMPQFASRLHPASQNASRLPHPYQPHASYKHPQDMRQRGLLPNDDIVYTNGPINGTTDAWSINFGFIVSNSFPVPNGGANITAMTFGAWLFPGDVLQSVEVSITSDEFGGTTYFHGVVNFTQSGCIGNQYGYNICTETGNFTVDQLDARTYWINLQNAQVNTGDPVYWDENSGPSLASETSTGTIPSEAFTILGTTTTCDYPPCPECAHEEPPNFTFIHRFTGTEGSPASGLAVAPGGKLYGVSSGDNQMGLAYQLSPHGQNWTFNPLYSFIGGDAGQSPSVETIGPSGDLYGVAAGGLQTCGSQGNQYCGIVYRLQPSAFACFTALCNWKQTVIYRFRGDPDGWSPGALVFDTAGHLYGTTGSGGLYGAGTVYALTQSNGEWTEKVLYSFTGGSDGGGPATLLSAEDGNLYGTTSGGGDGGGVIFQLTRSGDSWTETVIRSYDGCNHDYGGCGPRLIQGRLGRLYGIDYYDRYLSKLWGYVWWTFSHIYYVSRSPDGWQYTILYDTSPDCDPDYICNHGGYDGFNDIAVGAAGEVYGTYAFVEWGGPYDGGVFGPGVGVWFAGPVFGDVELGVDGNVYGTIGRCDNSQGTVWKMARSPRDSLGSR